MATGGVGAVFCPASGGGVAARAGGAVQAVARHRAATRARRFNAAP